jgi:hypothetical protein
MSDKSVEFLGYRSSIDLLYLEVIMASINKKLADTCEKLIKEGRIATVFVEQDYIVLKAYKDPKERNIRNKREVSAAIFRNCAGDPEIFEKLHVEYDGTNNAYRFWNVYLED